MKEDVKDKKNAEQTKFAFVKQVAPTPLPAVVIGKPEENGDMEMDEYYRYLKEEKIEEKKASRSGKHLIIKKV